MVLFDTPFNDVWWQSQLSRHDEIMLGADYRDPTQPYPDTSASRPESSTGDAPVARDNPLHCGQPGPPRSFDDSEFVDPGALGKDDTFLETLPTAEPLILARTADDIPDLMDFDVGSTNQDSAIQASRLQKLELERRRLEVERQILANLEEQHEIRSHGDMAQQSYNSPMNFAPYGLDDYFNCQGQIPFTGPTPISHTDTGIGHTRPDNFDQAMQCLDNTPPNGLLETYPDELESVALSTRDSMHDHPTSEPSLTCPPFGVLNSQTGRILPAYEPFSPQFHPVTQTKIMTSPSTFTLPSRTRLPSGTVKARINKKDRRWLELERRKQQSQLQKRLSRPLGSQCALFVLEVKNYQIALPVDNPTGEKKRTKQPNGTACLRCRLLKKPVSSRIPAS